MPEWRAAAPSSGVSSTWRCERKREPRCERVSGRAPHPRGGARVNGLRLGLARGWIGFRGMITSGEGVFQYVVFCGVPLAVLVLNGGSTIPGTGIAPTALDGPAWFDKIELLRATP